VKYCPKCGREYAGDWFVCLKDSSQLLEKDADNTMQSRPIDYRKENQDSIVSHLRLFFAYSAGLQLIISALFIFAYPALVDVGISLDQYFVHGISDSTYSEMNIEEKRQVFGDEFYDSKSHLRRVGAGAALSLLLLVMAFILIRRAPVLGPSIGLVAITNLLMHWMNYYIGFIVFPIVCSLYAWTATGHWLFGLIVLTVVIFIILGVLAYAIWHLFCIKKLVIIVKDAYFNRAGLISRTLIVVMIILSLILVGVAFKNIRYRYYSEAFKRYLDFTHLSVSNRA
jgi:hypothetical protein